MKCILFHEKLTSVPFGVMSQAGQKIIFLWWVGSPNGRSNFFWRGVKRELEQRNVTYRKHVALQCGCGVPTAE